jgi:hypothetical protein
LKSCFEKSTGIIKKRIVVTDPSQHPDIVGQTLPALSLYDGTRRMNVLPASLAVLRLKVPQWGG